MGEGFPLDPNHVQPVEDEQQAQQAAEATQIEVTSHDDAQDVRAGEENFVEDQDKAREMAEAGDRSRKEAVLSRKSAKELDEKLAEGSIDSPWPDNSRWVESAIENHFDDALTADDQADRLEDDAAAGYDLRQAAKTIPETAMRNKNRAEVMAHAENDVRNMRLKNYEKEQIYSDTKRAQWNYDQSLAAAKAAELGHTQVSEEEYIYGNGKLGGLPRHEREFQYSIAKRNEIALYSSIIAADYERTGDTPPLVHAALAEVHKFLSSSNVLPRETHFDAKFQTEAYRGEKTLCFSCKNSSIKIELGDQYFDKHEVFDLDSSQSGDASYAVTTQNGSNNGAGEFEVTITTKRRNLQPDDVDRLKELLSAATADRQKDREIKLKYQRERERN